MSTHQDAIRFWSMDTPGGGILVMECRHPDSNGEHPDVPLGGLWCAPHQRTIHYCDDLAILWCDGGPPDYHWHGFDLQPLESEV